MSSSVPTGTGEAKSARVDLAAKETIASKETVADFVKSSCRRGYRLRDKPEPKQQC